MKVWENIKENMPVTIKITLGSIIVIIGILTLYSGIQVLSYNFFNIYHQKEEIEERYYEIVSYVKESDEGDTKEEIISLFKNINRKSGEHLRIYKYDEIIYESDSTLWRNIITKDYNNEIKIEYIEESKYVILDSPIEIKGEIYSVEIVQNLRVPKQFVKRYFPIIVISVFTGLCLSIIGAVYVSKVFMKRLRGLYNTMEKVKKQGINERVALSDNNDEFDKVNAMFNSMMDDLEEAFEEQKRFVSDASHELRTPLTALKGHLGMIKRWGKNDKEKLEHSLDVCLSEVDRLNKIVNDLLLLSRAESNNVDLENVDEVSVDKVIYEVIENYTILSENITINTGIDTNIKMKISEDHLKQILIIFIDNAIKYNGKDHVNVDINSYANDDKIILKVKDNGMGIPEEDIKNITKRFYKVDESRTNNNSFGLGLSIANRIIKNYKGTLEIRSKFGEYTEILLCFYK